MRAGFAIAGLALSATLPATAGPRPGHAVRVERQHRLVGTPRLCVMQGASTMLCLGSRPEIGDAIDFVDETRYLGTAHVSRVEPQCKADSKRWGVEAAFDADLAKTDIATLAFGVIGLPLDHRGAHVTQLDDPHLSSDMVQWKAFGIDAEGRGQTAIAFVLGQCAPANTAAFCFDVWVDRGGLGLERAMHESFTEDCL